MVATGWGLTAVIKSAGEFVKLRTSEDPDDYHRAASEQAPLDVWWDVVDQFPEMRMWVAHNKTVPVEILEALARDSDARVRWHVASKNRLPAALLERLAADPDEFVRRRVVRHKHASVAVLQLLGKDESEGIRATALERLSRLVDR